MTEDLIRQGYEEQRNKVMRVLVSVANDLDEYRKTPKANATAIATRERMLNRMADFIDDADAAIDRLTSLAMQRYLEGVKVGEHRDRMEQERIWETTLSREGQRELIRKQAMAKWPELYDRDLVSYNDNTKPVLAQTYYELAQGLKNANT